MKGINLTFSLPFSLLTALPTPVSSLHSDHSLRLKKGTQSKGNVATVSKYKKHLAEMEGWGYSWRAGPDSILSVTKTNGEKQMEQSTWKITTKETWGLHIEFEHNLKISVLLVYRLNVISTKSPQQYWNSKENAKTKKAKKKKFTLRKEQVKEGVASPIMKTVSRQRSKDPWSKHSTQKHTYTSVNLCTWTMQRLVGKGESF